MTVQRLIKRLQVLEKRHGNLKVFYEDDYDNEPLEVQFATVEEAGEIGLEERLPEKQKVIALN